MSEEEKRKQKEKDFELKYRLQLIISQVATNDLLDREFNRIIDTLEYRIGSYFQPKITHRMDFMDFSRYAGHVKYPLAYFNESVS